MKLDIEPSESENFEQIAQMVRDFFTEEKQKDNRTVVLNWERIVPTVLERLRGKQENFKYYSIFKDNKLIGVINLYFDKDKAKDLGEILLWYIKPDYRGGGGKLDDYVLNWAVNTLKGLSVKKIRTEVLLEDKRAVDSVVNAGFKPFTGFYILEV